MATEAMSMYHEYIKPYMQQVFQLAASGYTDVQISQHFGVSKGAWLSYKKKHKELRDTLHKARHETIPAVLDAMLKRAVGYEAEEKLVQASSDPTTQRVLRQTTRVTKKHISPDPKAAQIWLENNQYVHGWKKNNDVSVSELAFHTTEIYELREENQWSAAKTAREFEKRGLQLPESLKMELRQELELQGGDTLPTPVIKIVMDGDDDDDVTAAQ